MSLDLTPLSVFDMLKIGVGPSSSHTLGPWRAMQRWLAEEAPPFASITTIRIHLYGSLALTGHGHATDQAIILALSGHDPETVDVSAISTYVARVRADRQLALSDGTVLNFDPLADIVFHPDERLPGHPNGMSIEVATPSDIHTTIYYSIGGGFIVGEHDTPGEKRLVQLPFPSTTPGAFREHCVSAGLSLAATVFENELAWRTAAEVRSDLLKIWRVMVESIHRGCHTEGTLPGGLGVTRRAPGLATRLQSTSISATAGQDPERWLASLGEGHHSFADILSWVNAFALAVNEENAALGRVVTAPTNGAAGVVPAVLGYHVAFADSVGRTIDDDIVDFLLVAGEIATQFKKGATISAAMGGCQAEIGVSSAMAAGALTAIRGGSVDQAFMAAEIAIEHHFGLTCDPIDGLVQVPCIERNTMGAVKAINAAELALAGDPADARVSLAEAIATLRATAEDMSDRYKETSTGGLAVNVSVRVAEC